jgi:arrestin-related trafficking adapter 4/5/7
LTIPGSIVKSIEGLADAHVKYKLKTVVIRGRLSYNFYVFKPVCIIRTLDLSALERTMSLENLWTNKVKYSIVVSQSAVVFRTSIQIEVKFTPLLKRLKIRTIQCDLVELYDWTLKFPTFGYQYWKKSQEIGSWKFEVNEEDHYQDMSDRWVLNETLLLPKSLKHCIQDVETPEIKIHYKIKFNITLQNPDRHISEVRISLSNILCIYL